MQTCEELHGGGLATPVLAYDDDELAWLDREGDVCDGILVRRGVPERHVSSIGDSAEFCMTK